MQYKNWTEKKVPRGYVVVEGWVMPEYVSHYFPGDDIVSKCGASFYMSDGLGWDLIENEYVDM